MTLLFSQILLGLFGLLEQILLDSVPVLSVFCAYIVIFILQRFFLSDSSVSGGSVSRSNKSSGGGGGKGGK